ncbi:DNA protecting protein DprA [Moraxella porci DSM 25326]|uniref:DNA protecting protein DprA n=1 Tax=Moraxella porci DSM 25326 TaxID=573983 RepID=A0A1T0CP01_9GAMM|nr:DNA-processing protein DprA [Moraxella porci]OOS24070.1 DNA protecting protein DprA [Moraxella porci DSM 25326]
MAYATVTRQQSMLALWYVTNASLISYRKLSERFGDAKSALTAAKSDWQALGIHAAHIDRWQDEANTLAFIDKVAHDVSIGSYSMCFLGDEDYPQALMAIYDPPPVLFYRGDLSRLNERQIAIVGSRTPTEDAQKITFDLAQYLVQAGFVVTSGLAQGVDRQAHLGALAQLPALSGRTIGVMGTGIDVCYPRNHTALFAQIVAEGGCLISELLPSTPASKHTFPRRNRLVAGLSLATVVTEAALQSGSLITARLSAEMGKQVFAIPSSINNPNAEGCHHLIREGATLIYHPEQIIEDLNQGGGFFNALPKTFSQGMSVYAELSSATTPAVSTPNKSTVIVPEHLSAVYDMMDEPRDLDALVMMSGHPVAQLLSALMELEILGLIQQTGGRYAKS